MMWQCPLCGEKEPIIFQIGHMKHCKNKKQEKAPERLIGKPNEDLGYRFFPSTKEDWDL